MEETEDFRRRTEEEIEKIITQARAEAQTLDQQAKEDLRGLINEFKSKGRTEVHRLEQTIRAEEQKISRWRLPEGSQGPGGRYQGGNEPSSALPEEENPLSRR